MGTTEKYVVEQLKGIHEYDMYFEAAFPNQAEPITFVNVSDATAAFETTC